VAPLSLENWYGVGPLVTVISISPSPLSSSGVPDPGDALGVPDGNGAQLYDNGDQLALDLSDLLTSGGSVDVRWMRTTGWTPAVNVDISTDGSSWTFVSNYNVTSDSWTTQTISLSIDTRYIRFTTTNVYNLSIDAISYNTPCAPPCTDPVITDQPDTASVCDGGNTSFTVAATGTTLTYQWQEDDGGGGGFSNITNGGVYGGATTTTLTLTGVTSSMDTYDYRCVVFSGACSTNSDAATLTVHSLPTFTFASTDLTCFESGDGEIEITVTSGPTPYQFSSDNGATWVPGTPTTSPYTFKNLVANNPYKIRVRDNNGCESPAAP